MALVKFEEEKRKRGERQKERKGGGGGGDGGSAHPLPEECPVTAIGRSAAREDGGAGRYWFFDGRGELVGLTAQQMAQSAQLNGLFGGDGAGKEWLKRKFPQYDREGEPTGWYSARDAGSWLVAQCIEAGRMRDDEPRRGIGVWRGRNGAIVHTGDEVRYYRRDAEPGKPYQVRRAGFRDEGALWPAHASVPAPGKPATAAEAREILLHMDRWAWQSERGADVFFGLYAAGLLGAAIRWRPHGLVVGPPGTGKSSLLELYEAASPIAYPANDYTEAGLRQDLSLKSAPLILDEAEGDETGKLQAVIRFLRKMSGGSGMRAVRGSSGGASQRFEVSAPAVLGAVLPPTLEPQDRTRITRLDLGPAVQGKTLPSLEDLAAIRDMALRLWSRALAGIPRMEANFDAFRNAIIAAGAPPRMGDQIGTILAARAMMLRDRPLSADEAAAEVGIFMRAGYIRTKEELAAEEGPALCLAHLLQSPADLQEHGERPTIGQLSRRSLSEEADGDHARRVLRGHGLKVAPFPPTHPNGPRCLYVANSHPRLRKCFAGSRWSEGRWHEDLRNLPGAIVPKQAVHIDGTVRATAIPLDLVLTVLGPVPGQVTEKSSPPAPPNDDEEHAPAGPSIATQHCGNCFWYAGKDRKRGRCLSDHQGLHGAAAIRQGWCQHWRPIREGAAPPPLPAPSQ